MRYLIQNGHNSYVCSVTSSVIQPPFLTYSTGNRKRAKYFNLIDALKYCTVLPLNPYHIYEHTKFKIIIDE